tara:strand:+ start:729 stop:878 length:150 start_codon:yes stop_codon:yes gene_type:complete
MTSCELKAEQEVQYPQLFSRKPFQSIGVAPYIEHGNAGLWIWASNKLQK